MITCLSNESVFLIYIPFPMRGEAGIAFLIHHYTSLAPKHTVTIQYIW